MFRVSYYYTQPYFTFCILDLLKPELSNEEANFPMSANTYDRFL